MIYNSFTDINLCDGDYYFVRAPYMDGYEIISVNDNLSQKATIKYPDIHGVSKITGKPMIRSLHQMDVYYTGIIISDSIDEIEKERTKIIFRLKNELQLQFNGILTKIDTELKKSNYYINIKKYPEALI